MAVITNVVLPSKGRLRPFDVRRDLDGVADLVELCFGETLDRDGQRYLKQMRDAAQSAAQLAGRNSSFLQWASSVVEPTSLPLSGYICEERGHLVGNLSLIPFYLRGRLCYLIANVAVHPDYRRQGIARALTSKALEHARNHWARAAWLHVREDNDPAIRLYLSLGFQERARRTTWHSYPPGAESYPAPYLAPIAPLAIQSGGSHHWSQEQAWLRNIYPPEVVWHLSINWNAVRPGLWGSLYRMLTGIQVRHWVARRGDALLAGLVWQSAYAHGDTLWLAAPAIVDGPAITSLLQYARQGLSPRRPLALDFPAGEYTQDIRAAGFAAHHTLIWMEAPF